MNSPQAAEAFSKNHPGAAEPDLTGAMWLSPEGESEATSEGMGAGLRVGASETDMMGKDIEATV